MINYPKLIIKNDRFYFVDNRGCLSKDNFASASRYSEGFAFVQKDDGLYYYRDMFGNLSKNGYYFALNYYQGYGIVKLTQTSKFYFVDFDGNVSDDSYEYISHYCNGFARVQNGRNINYRDLIGNLTKKKTYLGKRIYHYFSGKISLSELLNDPQVPYDPKLRGFVLRNEKHKLRQKFLVDELEKCNDEKIKRQIDNTLNKTLALIKDYEKNSYKLNYNYIDSTKANKFAKTGSFDGQNESTTVVINKQSENLLQNRELSERKKALIEEFEKMLDRG